MVKSIVSSKENENDESNPSKTIISRSIALQMQRQLKLSIRKFDKVHKKKNNSILNINFKSPIASKKVIKLARKIQKNLL